ncbi:hypothetical protein SELMODRAFT_459, partial [Selaginella moellendorffii]
VAMYTALIGAYARSNDPLAAFTLLRQMQADGIPPNRITLVEILSACTALHSIHLGDRIHQWIIDLGLHRDSVLGTALLTTFARCGSLDRAKAAFTAIARKDLIAWNAIITATSHSNRSHDALDLFRRMQLDGIHPNAITLVAVLSIFQESSTDARAVHSLAMESAMDASTVAVGNSIVNMYARCRDLDRARLAFARIQSKNVVSWNVMISAHSQLDRLHPLAMFHAMMLEGIKADATTFVNLASGLAAPSPLRDGELLHRCARELGGGRTLIYDAVLATSLVTMFAKCGSVAHAREIFRENFHCHERNPVVWNAIIAALVQNHDFSDALLLFRTMQLQGVPSDAITFVSTIDACTALEDFPTGRALHGIISESSLETDTIVATALVNFYSKSRRLDAATAAFQRIHEPDLVAWNVLIAAHVDNANSSTALEIFFHRMELKPDRITFITTLAACVTASALPLGRRLHEQIRQRGLHSDVVVASALVDMYSKCGSLEEAYQVFSTMAGRRNSATWNALIAGHAQHGFSGRAPSLVREMQLEGVEPDSLTYVGLLLACTHAGLLEDGCKFFAALVEDKRLAVKEEHYGCVVDLLGRAGKLAEAEEFLLGLRRAMPVAVSAAMWTSLLSAYGVHGDMELARRAARRVLDLEPRHPAAFVVLSN